MNSSKCEFARTLASSCEPSHLLALELVTDHTEVREDHETSDNVSKFQVMLKVKKNDRKTI
jgi:hypothetical protein